MAVPQQVREQHERVEQMMQPNASEAELQPDPSQEAIKSEPEPKPEPEPEPEPESTSEIHDTVANLQAELKKSEQRYRTLNGMIRQKDNTIRQMELLLAQLNTEQPDQTQEQAPSQDTQKDRDEFGDDLVDMVERAIARRIEKIESRLTNAESGVRTTSEFAAQSQQDRFYAQLAQRVPDWKEIDTTPEFATWLQESKARLTLVQHAMANYDVVGIAELFELYKAITSKGQETESRSQKPARPSLEQKVAPSKSRSSNAPAPSEKRTWTRSEIAQVYRDRRKYSQKDFDALQRDIFAAQKEGRVDYQR